MAFMDRFFGLLNQHFPKRLENDDRNLIYNRRMNAGEFVHFMSGAVGRNLSGMAATGVQQRLQPGPVQPGPRPVPADHLLSRGTTAGRQRGRPTVVGWLLH